MNIYAKKGTKIVYTGEGGYPFHKEIANKHLKIGDIYTVERTEVYDWHTDVFLREVPAVAFNSVHFEELKIKNMNNKTIQFKTCACCGQPIEKHSLSHTEDGQAAHYDCIQKSEQDWEQYYEMLDLMGY